MAFSFFKRSEKAAPTPKGPRYYDLTVKGIVQETADTLSVVFEQPANPILYKSGQFLTLIAVVNGKEIRRSYSLCTSPFTDTDLAVTVKRVE